MPFRLLIILSLFLALPVSLDAQARVFIHEDKTAQTIHGFGASGAWSNELINRWNSSQRMQVADWLFSTKEKSDTSYKGIGLSVWRFNLGAGSAEQGDSSYIGNPSRRAECFLNADGSYNFSKQSGDQWMLAAAKERGVEKLVLFANSPPVHLTTNKKAFAGTCGKCNIEQEKYEAYAHYLVNSLNHFEKINLPISYVSPFNEPEWGWCQRDGQEGCPYRNEEIAAITRILSRQLEEQHLSNKIQIPESGLLAFANPGYKFKPGRQNEINSFFRKSSKNYLGNESHVALQVCAHSYFTEWPLKMMKSIRKRTANTCRKRGIEYWMTEYCILLKNSEIEGGGRDLGMHTALYVARVVHNDLVYGNASSWQWWLALSTADYKDGLVYANEDGSGITDSKTLWMLGNFSQFIRPGAVRMGVKVRGGNQLLVSAYQNTSGNKILVVINQSEKKQYLQLDQFPGKKISSWETSDRRNLMRMGVFSPETAVPVSPRSITTLVIEE